MQVFIIIYKHTPNYNRISNESFIEKPPLAYGNISFAFSENGEWKPHAKPGTPKSASGLLDIINDEE